MIVDAQPNLIAGIPQKNKERDETIGALIKCIDDWSVEPKAICGDDYFHEEKFQRWYKYKGIKPIPLGPNIAERPGPP